MNFPENPSRLQVSDLFLEALEKPSPVDRAAFLDEACAGDAGLREAVEELLAYATDKEQTNLELRCQRDGGIIVYLDGKEVLRDNMEAGADVYLLHSAETMGAENDGVVHRFPIPGTLAARPHTLAISVHNTAKPSSNLRLGGVTLVEVKTSETGKCTQIVPNRNKKYETMVLHQSLQLLWELRSDSRVADAGRRQPRAGCSGPATARRHSRFISNVEPSGVLSRRRVLCHGHSGRAH